MNCPKHPTEPFVYVDMRNGKTAQVCKLCVQEKDDWIGKLFSKGDGATDTPTKPLERPDRTK